MIKPTIGRIVWYYPRAGHREPYAAIICRVHSNTLVNIAYFDENGTASNAGAVKLYQGEDIALKPYDNFCEWMPYQHGQAAKTEAAEAKVDLMESEVAKN